MKMSNFATILPRDRWAGGGVADEDPFATDL